MIKTKLKQLLLFLSLAHLALVINMQAYATTLDAPTPPANTVNSVFQDIGNQTGLESYYETGIHPDSPDSYNQPGVDSLTSPVLFMIDILRYLLSTIAIIVIILAAVRQIGSPTEDEATKNKQLLTFGTLGFIIVQFADVLVTRMFFGEQGEAFESPATAQEFAEQSVSQIRGVVGLINIFIGSIAVMVIVYRGIILIGSQGAEDAIDKAKNQIVYAVLGLILIGLSEVVIRGVIFPENGQQLPDSEVFKKVIISIVNFLSGFIALFAFVTLLYAGYRYVVSAGNEEATEKVKKTFFSATIAIILALGAFAAANTFITLDETPSNLNQENEIIQ